ncbi:MAG: hypothetical protein ABIN89_08620 [Chitinophagaceae bacterium]
MNQVVENVGSFIMIVAVFAIVAWVINAAFNYSLKKRMIDLGRIDESSLKFLAKPVEARLQNVKWGLLFFFGGLGLVIIEFLPYKGDESPLPYGIEAICLAIGFFLYYIIARRQKS